MPQGKATRKAEQVDYFWLEKLTDLPAMLQTLVVELKWNVSTSAGVTPTGTIDFLVNVDDNKGHKEVFKLGQVLERRPSGTLKVYGSRADFLVDHTVP